ncbi:hypothetical protein AA0119_g11787 [Alternaria tenuissima]|uniref:Heterokaryon incompatibility domain-containing protein n=1 Tax=Alternaria tenuissima TaxID=119927 RepID=A0AB37WD74_9PLEO|nr:hypothetical protein AA0115_g8961 [Alternaria tenuissima]RYN88480.1 hypothetical protein AA0119_g11787 [Alternaria tenuissima]
MAVELGQQEVQRNKSQLGSENRLTLSNMFELGRALHGDGRVEKALQVFRELLPLSEKVLGPCHLDTIATLDAICEELCNMGKYDLSLTHLIEERQRCEQALGPQHERTIRVLVDIANMSKLLNKTDDASSMFSLALDRSQRGLGQRHELTLAILNDLRGLQESLPPNLEQMKALLRQNGLPISTKPFPNSRSTTFQERMAGSELTVMMSAGYEATNALSLRLGPIQAKPKPQPPFFVPPYHEDTRIIRLKPIPARHHLDHSFRSLINRSIAILPQKQRGEASTAIHRAIDNHIAFLKSVKTLDELLTAKQNPVWFFQRRESFMQQITFQRWDSHFLKRYVLLLVEGGLANPVDCIFISHYWRTQPHPDPDGEDLRQLQHLLNDGFWSNSAYIWVDWTCLPQWGRTAPQQQYFSRVLPSIPRLVRDCSFMAHFPEFRPRLWVLFEVAAFTFNQAEPVGLPCTDSFKKHLLMMNGDGVRPVLDRYGYSCTNKFDREWVITWLEILLALRRTTPSIHTRRQILDAIDNSKVRSCVHQGAGVEIDKERGILKANGTIHLFNPLPVEDEIPRSISEVCIAGDYELRLRKVLRRADESFDNAGVGEMAREYDRAGDYDIAECLHRRAMATCEDLATSHDLVTNLENQGKYEDAVAQCRRDITRPDPPIELHQKLRALEQKKVLFDRYRRWTLQPLEANLKIAIPHWPIIPTQATLQPPIRNGLKRSWLQRLDQSVWQCEDPVVMKSMEEHGLELEEQGRFSEAQKIHWRLLGRRKELLGPCHVETRRSISSLARAFQLAGNALNAHVLYIIAHAVCDFTLGPRHPESRAVLGDVAAAVLLQNKLGLAKAYYRQLLERTLAVVEWDDPEAFPPKFFLQALIGNEALRIVQADEATTVNIVRYSPLQGGEQSHQAQRRRVILDLEDVNLLWHRYIVSK